MNLNDSSKDILLDSFELDALPAGPTEFTLDFPMCAVSELPFDELIGSHGIEIKFKYRGEWVARRGCEIVVQYKDEKLMEENMPDEILAEHLLVRAIGIRGPKKVTKASVQDKEVENSSNNTNNNKENSATTTTSEAAPEKVSGQIRPRNEEEQKEAGNNVPVPSKQEE